MTRNLAASGAFALALLAASAAHAAADADLAQIRDEIRQLKESYEARIQALEQRLREAEARTVGATSPPAAPQLGAPPTVATRRQPRTRAARAVPSRRRLSAFNPAISAVLQGVYTNLSQDPDRYAIHGFVPGGDIAPPKRGFSIAESELGLSASVDDKIFGNLIFSLTPDNTIEVEEAYGVFTAVPNGFTPKIGRFLSAIGYLNDQHQHVWDFFDAPLPYQAFLGGQFKSDGLQLKWVAPTETFLEFGGEIGDGSSFPGTDRNKNGIGSGAAYVHAGGDIGTSNSWRAGLSYLQLRPNGREYAQDDLAGNSAQLAFSGKSQLAIADFVWKWAPNGNAMDTNFKLQGEYFWRKENGDLTYDSDGALGLTSTSTYSSRSAAGTSTASTSSCRTGAWARGTTGSPRAASNYGANGIYLAQDSFNPQRYSVMLDYTPSEFSRFRVQWQQSKVRPDVTDNQLFVQYILTLGAHGAHKF